MAGLDVQIEGQEELKAKLDPSKLLGMAVTHLFQKAALEVERQAKINASGRPGPRVQTGRLRSSITHSIEAVPIPTWAAVGTNVIYAAPLEFGSSRWKSGVRYPFLYPALEQKRDVIDQLLGEAASKIEERFSE